MGLVSPAVRVGFIGLGVMGTPMALNLTRQFPVTVWNRNTSKYPALQQAGATVAETPSKVVEQSDFIFTMLFDDSALQSILDEDFRKALSRKTLINTSSVPIEFSETLATIAQETGGTFVEMPVSGSRVPAEQGRLVGMMAGDQHCCNLVRPIVKPFTSKAIYCGPIGSGLKTKYAVNNYLITMTAGLAESMNLARAQGLDLQALGDVLNAGPMASPYSKLKIDKMLRADWSAQASIKDCYNSTILIEQAAKKVGARAPIISLCGELYGGAKEQGMGEEDMVALTKAFARQE